MRGSPAPSSASSSASDLSRSPAHSRSDLRPGTAGDYSLSASLSACTLLSEGAVEPMQIDVDPQEDPQNAPDVNYVVENPTLDLDHCDFPELLSPSNVAVYGGLCALATFDRQELQRNVISSSSFKLFLELEPQVRDIIFKFYESKYASCLKMLDEMKDNLLLDMYLAPHVRTLYTQIRNRALIQYFSPYVSADMHKMAAAFNTTVAALEDELTQLILEGLINARIDSHMSTNM